MTQDPIQPLADIGRRVLQTVRRLARPPVPDQPLESYEGLLRDPVVTMSGICNELLERLAAAPVAAEPQNLPNEPGSRFIPAPNQGSAFPTFSRAGVAATRILADRHDEAADSRRENQATERPDTPGPDLDGTSPFEESRRSIDDPVPSPDEPGTRDPRETAAREPEGAAPQTDSPAAPPLRPAIDGSDRYPAARQTARRARRSRNMQHPVERFLTGEQPVGSVGEPSPEEHSSETQPPARQEWSETRQTGLPSDARASDVPARGTGESDISFPLHGSRLTGSTERLAAMLRAHVAQPVPVTRTADKESQEGKDVFSSREGHDERGAAGIVDEPAQTCPVGRSGIEEIMERLADELETEFVRTYGRSGG
jgi:hypothetical protein